MNMVLVAGVPIGMVEMPMCVDELPRGLAERAGDVLTDLIHARSIPSVDNRTSLWRANRRYGTSGSGESEDARTNFGYRERRVSVDIGKAPAGKSAAVIAILLPTPCKDAPARAMDLCECKFGLNEVMVSRSNRIRTSFTPEAAMPPLGKNDIRSRTSRA
jgi:hypothetical protein